MRNLSSTFGTSSPEGTVSSSGGAFQCDLFIHLLHKRLIYISTICPSKQSRLMCISRHLTWLLTNEDCSHSIFFQLLENCKHKPPVNLLRMTNRKTVPSVWQQHKGWRARGDQFPWVDAPFPSSVWGHSVEMPSVHQLHIALPLVLNVNESLICSGLHCTFMFTNRCIALRYLQRVKVGSRTRVSC